MSLSFSIPCGEMSLSHNLACENKVLLTASGSEHSVIAIVIVKINLHFKKLEKEQ